MATMFFNAPLSSTPMTSWLVDAESRIAELLLHRAQERSILRHGIAVGSPRATSWANEGPLRAPGGNGSVVAT